MTESTGKVVTIEMPERQDFGHFGENWRAISLGCSDRICLVIEGKDPEKPITWEVGDRSIVLCDAGEHYHPGEHYREEPLEGRIVYLNPVNQDEALWGVSNAETTAQQLWDRGLLPIAVIRRDEYGSLDWVIFHQQWEPAEGKQEPA